MTPCLSVLAGTSGLTHGPAPSSLTTAVGLSPSGYIPQDGSHDFITHCDSSEAVTESEDGYSLEPAFGMRGTPSPQASPLGWHLWLDTCILLENVCRVLLLPAMPASVFEMSTYSETYWSIAA